MLGAWNSLFCQLFHSSHAECVSYSRHAPWRCTKPGCGAQRAHDARLAVARHNQSVSAETTTPTVGDAATMERHPEHNLLRRADGALAAD
jgi:hypothetical protein